MAHGLGSLGLSQRRPPSSQLLLRALHCGTHGIPCGQRQQAHGPLLRDLTRAARIPAHRAGELPAQGERPDNEKKTGYIPVWLDDAGALGTMRGIVRLDVASSATDVSPDTHYKSYAPANNAFAQAVAKEWREGDLVWQRTSNDARTRPAGARWSSLSPRGMEMETKEREMEMGMGINSRCVVRPLVFELRWLTDLRLGTLAACDTSTNDNDRVARRAWTADTRRRYFLLIPIPIPMPIPHVPIPIPIALPLCLPPSLPFL